VLTVARLYRAAFEHLDLVARPKVTGAGGLEIWVPIARGPDVESTRRWVEQLSIMVSAVVPELASRRWRVDEQGLLAPYSPRPAPGAPVSAPIDWDELDDPALRPDGFTIRTISERLVTKGDLFREVLASDQHLPKIS
jgi:bifunctional non-homologous end joining protein LigD